MVTDARTKCYCSAVIAVGFNTVFFIGEVANKLLSNPPAGQCYSLANQGVMSEQHSVPSQHFPPSSSKGRPRSSNKKSKAKSPYPFSVESMNSGCQQPSPQVSVLTISLVEASFQERCSTPAWHMQLLNSLVGWAKWFFLDSTLCKC